MEKTDWIIELTDELKNMAGSSLHELERWKKRSIYKIPIHAANLNREAYTPWVVAIGPYHHMDEQLQRMEEHKKRALCYFLHRTNKPLASYVHALAEVVNDLMDAYGYLDETWRQDAKSFLQLMIVDGCFILETMRANNLEKNDYDPSDLIFGSHGKKNAIPCIRRDMLLLENQVPLLVLEKLHAVGTDDNQQSETQVIGLILKFLGRSATLGKIGKCQHILDVFRKIMVRKVQINTPRPLGKPNVVEGTIHSVTEMKQAGIKIKRSRHDSVKDISFNDRALCLPPISLDDTSESTYLNMVAFERLHVGTGNEISSYIYFMNRLISDVSDVHLLQSHNIISNSMSSDDDVRKLFLTLSKEIVFDSSTELHAIYSNIHEKLKSHFKRTLFSWRYHLIHTYFRSPWTFVSVIAAAVGLCLSIAQVVYGVLSFVHRKH